MPRFWASDGSSGSHLMSPHFSRGTATHVAFVLSCPGRHEELAGHPAAGNTGKNLGRLLEYLGPRLDLPHLERSHVTIANAWAGIEYKDKTGRSEASDLEVRQADNIFRLAHELRHVTLLIVFCGEKAKLAAQELRELELLPNSIQFALVPHIGGQGLNNCITSDVANRPIVGARKQRQSGRLDSLKAIQRENTSRRLEVIVERLLQSRVPVRQSLVARGSDLSKASRHRSGRN